MGGFATGYGNSIRLWDVIGIGVGNRGWEWGGGMRGGGGMRDVLSAHGGSVLGPLALRFARSGSKLTLAHACVR